MKNSLKPKYKRLKVFVSENKDIYNMAQMRNLIHFKEKNGASIWVKKISGRIFVDEDAFFQWMKEGGSRGNS